MALEVSTSRRRNQSTIILSADNSLNKPLFPKENFAKAAADI